MLCSRRCSTVAATWRVLSLGFLDPGIFHNMRAQRLLVDEEHFPTAAGPHTDTHTHTRSTRVMRRHLDAAHMYETEADVGAAIRGSRVPREESLRCLTCPGPRIHWFKTVASCCPCLRLFFKLLQVCPICFQYVSNPLTKEIFVTTKVPGPLGKEAVQEMILKQTLPKNLACKIQAGSDKKCIICM